MKKFISIFIIIQLFLCIIFTRNIKSQVLVSLLPPQDEQLSLSDLWNATLQNMSENTYKVYLSTSVEEEKDGKVLETTSESFDLSPGLKSISKANLNNIKINFVNDKYKEIFSKSDKFPGGGYTYCISLISEEGKEISKDCKTKYLQTITLHSLIAPTNNIKVENYPLVFSWNPPNPLTKDKTIMYSLIVVNVKTNQTPEEAINSNKPLFKKTDIYMKDYSTTETENKLMRKYDRCAWMVTAYYDTGEIIGNSEIRNFIPGSSDLIPSDCKFEDIIVKYNNEKKELSCNSNITIPVKTMITVNAEVDGTGKKPAYFWEIKREGIIISSGKKVGKLSFDFTPSSEGDYSITLTANRGKYSCGEGCILYIKVEK